MYFAYGQTETDYLKAKDSRLAAVIDRLGHINRTVDTDLFSSVVHHIIGQQISTKAQTTIWQRMQDALGTVTAQTASVALALVWLKSRRTNIHVKRSDLRPQPEVLSSILKIGVPVAVQDGCIQVAFMFITVIANHRGLVDAAAVGLVEKMISFLFIVPSSMGATVSALTAQNAGAGKGDRARQVLKDAMTISVVYGCLITVLMWLVAPAFIGFFAKDAAVVAAGTGYMRSYIFDAIFAGIHICFSGFFAAYGKSYIGFAHNVLAVALIRVPGAWLLSNAYSDTLFPMGIASPCGSILSAAICVVAFTVLNRRGAFDKLTA
mgnify:CR=1 FL=1